MTQDELKQSVAKAALDYIEEGSIIGVGTGSTVNFFIDQLATVKSYFKGAVASSIETEKRLKSHGINIVDFNSVDELSLYIDGADSYNVHRQLIKGGGGALTREKILATASKQFICIVDETKKVDVLGEFPIPVEVIPFARSFIAREIVKLGGHPVYRQNTTTDNGNIILDVHNIVLLDPVKFEHEFNNIPGVVCNGIFAVRNADMILVATHTGMKVIGASSLLLNKLLK